MRRFQSHLDELSGGESLVLLSHFLLKTIEGRKMFKQVSEQQVNSSLSRVVQSLKEERMPSDPLAFVRPLARVLQRQELHDLGWKLSKKQFTAARKVIEKKRKGNAPLSPATKDKIQQFYYSRTEDMANRTIKKNGVVTPCRGRLETIRELHCAWQSDEQNQPVSLSTFYKCKPAEVKRAKRKTDMCDICVGYREYVKRQRTEAQALPPPPPPPPQLPLEALPQLPPEARPPAQGGPLPPTRAPPPVVDYASLYESHILVANKQRAAFNKRWDEVEFGDYVIVTDFKENLKVNIDPVETSRHFYHRQQITCLGFVVVTRSGPGGHIVKRHFNFLSEVLSHDGKFVTECTLECIRQLKLRNRVFNNISFWYDCARHFRSRETMRCLLQEVPKLVENCGITMHHFGEHHGKSPADQHFSVISNALKAESKKKGIYTIQDLQRVLEERFTRVDPSPSSYVHFVIITPKERELIEEVTLAIGNAPISMSAYHYVERVDGTKAKVSVLSDGASPMKECTITYSSRKDERKTKVAPPAALWTPAQRDDPPFGSRTVAILREQIAEMRE